ncbi:hypothetical protein SAMN04488109_3773 [Chryseolinea serpens]|uniref:Uncharacterized protein n=1 Tax=Chryseolinea serpens TaxID=947013 RepID=A0A1M5S6J2_9BACT|nr:hypothetical protein SAMN04488109_3773 [Chryseolinea serpens]
MSYQRTNGGSESENEGVLLSLLSQLTSSFIRSKFSSTILNAS